MGKAFINAVINFEGMLRTSIILFCLLAITGSAVLAQSAALYRPLHGGQFNAPPVPASPDPLIRYRWANPHYTDPLQVYPLYALKAKASPAASFVQHNHAFNVQGPGTLMFDFGVESAAWLEFDADNIPAGTEITMSISEYNEPAIVNAGAAHPVKTAAPVKHGNTYRLELNDALYEGVRFGWIHINKAPVPFTIKEVRLVCQVKPVNYAGSFSCSDTVLNRIWYTGAYTVKLNLMQDYFGAILMERSDRHSWTGDAYPAQAASLVAFANYNAVKENIRRTAGKDNDIPAYSLYWVLSLAEYFNYTGDTAFLQSLLPVAASRLKLAYREYDSIPSLGFMGWDERLGAGFEHPQLQECQDAYKMLCIHAWKDFSTAMLAAGDTAAALLFSRYAAEKTAGLSNGSASFERYGVHAIAEALNAGLTDPGVLQQAAACFKDRLNRLSYSPFNQYFIIQAMARSSFIPQALTTIRDCWGGQLHYGGTSFFEVYRPSWNAILKPNDAPPNNQCGYTSLAHPWGAGVTCWLSRNILGIRSAAPGFKQFVVKPYLQNGLTYVKGVVPAPSGNIVASFDIRSGQCELTVPPGTQAVKVGLPKGGRKIAQLRINNRLYNTAVEDSNYVYVSNLQPGRYVIRIQYRGMLNSSALQEPPLSWRLHTFIQDSVTSGSWRGKYGKDGFAFFEEGARVNESHLPSYTGSITTNKAGFIRWQTADTGRTAGAIITRDPLPTQQTFTIDLPLKEKHPVCISLYFLDPDAQQRRSAVEIFDLDTLAILAPVQLIEHYEKGKYLRFTVDRPVRIRVNQVRGKNAALAGLFFDRP